MVGRIVRTADFESVLAQAPRSRSAHFAVHHLAANPSLPARKRTTEPVVSQLSTAGAPTSPQAVDESSASRPQGVWLGTVVPKRHARRAVTRNLLKRQMRAVMAAQAGGLPAGLWVLRLKSAFDPRQFPSPASQPLRHSVHVELQALLQRAAVAR